MDAFGFVYLVVGHDEIIDIARHGLMSSPVQLESDGGLLVDGFYFSTSEDHALRARNFPMPHLLRLNIDSVSEVTKICQIDGQGCTVDFVAGGASPFTIPALEIEFRTPNMTHWRSLDLHRNRRATTSRHARTRVAGSFKGQENAVKISA